MKSLRAAGQGMGEAGSRGWRSEVRRQRGEGQQWAATLMGRPKPTSQELLHGAEHQNDTDPPLGKSKDT